MYSLLTYLHYTLKVKMHVKSKDISVKYPCDECAYEATHRGSLWRHMKSIHEGVKYSCDQCDYKAAQKGHLLKHVKSIHECAGVKFPRE